ncbi:MAG: hypothetical protein TREMPRED_005731 [Tremellales sp. Tagirdzhanova-0007]|nr:MAG: hypothetical protein TREMPRED_005731 [Tremellales sp. Tagirdzhanova-0007]
MAILREIDGLRDDGKDMLVIDKPKAASIPNNLEADLVAGSSLRPELDRPPKRQKRITRHISSAPIAKSLNDVINATQYAPYQIDIHADTSRQKQLTRTVPDEANSMPEFLQIRGHQALVQVPPRSAPMKRFTPPQSNEPKYLWINHLAIKNPPWYEDARCMQYYGRDSIAVLASLHLCQDRILVRSLERLGFEIVERESSIQGADLVISASTAILFRQLRILPTQITDIMQNLKLATNYFSRVILVFEVVAYGVMEKRTDTLIPSVDPLSPIVLTTLSALRRSIAITIVPGMSGTIGFVELVFATQGATEVSKVLTAISDHEAKRLESLIGVKEALEVCGTRPWLWREGSEDEVGLVDQYGVNSFSALYILHHFGSFLKLVEELDEDQRKEFLGPVIGEEVVLRFNDLLRPRLKGFRQLKGHSLSDASSYLAADDAGVGGSDAPKAHDEGWLVEEV